MGNDINAQRKASREAIKLEKAARKQKYADDLAQFRAAEMVWCYPADEDCDHNVYYLTKEDGIKLIDGADPDNLVLVANPGEIRIELTIPSSFFEASVAREWVITAHEYEMSPHAGEPDFDRAYRGGIDDDDEQIEEVTQAQPEPASKPVAIQYDLFTADPTPTEGTLTPTSWTPPANMTYDQWDAIGQKFQRMHGSVNWWLGAWINEGERRFGEKYTQAIQITGHGLENLKKAAWVERNVKKENRVDGLSWTHHHHVAHLDEAAQVALLNAAAKRQLSSRELHAEVKNYLALLEAPTTPTEAPEADDVPFTLRTDDSDGEDEADATEAGTIAIDYQVEATPTAAPDVIEAVRETLQFIDYAPTDWRDAANDRWFGKTLIELRGTEDDKFFVDRLIKEFRTGKVDEAITLTPNRTNTDLFQRLLALYPACFLAEHGQVVFYLGKYPAHFAEKFKHLGRTVKVI